MLGDRSRRNICSAQNHVLKPHGVTSVAITNARNGCVCIHENKKLNDKVEYACACKKVVDEDLNLNSLFIGSSVENNHVGEDVECLRGIKINDGDAVMKFFCAGEFCYGHRKVCICQILTAY